MSAAAPASLPASLAARPTATSSNQSLVHAPSVPHPHFRSVASASLQSGTPIVSKRPILVARNDHNVVSSVSPSLAPPLTPSLSDRRFYPAGTKYDPANRSPSGFTSTSTKVTKILSRSRPTQPPAVPSRTNYPQGFNHNHIRRSHEYNLDRLLSQTSSQMQAAASLFMNRPGHRGAADSISGDSLSSEVVSFASQDPLISSRHSPRPAPPPSPPTNPLLTLNTLDPAERAALIRQSKKLNKVLGATPHIAEASGAPLQRRGTLPSPGVARPSPRAAGGSTSSALASRARAAKSLIVSVPDPGQFATPKAPFLRIATHASTRRPSESPTLRRRASDTSISSSATGASFAFAPLSPVPGANPQSSSSRPSQDSFQTPDSQLSPAGPPSVDGHASLMTTPSIDSSLSVSLASPVFSPRTAQELASLQRQQTRARMAKLQRIMGENVPSELVLPTAGRASTSSRRRLSIDLPPIANDAGRLGRAKHKRTKSMWKKDGRDDTGFESAPEPVDQLGAKRGKKFSDGSYPRSSEESGVVNVLRPPLTERQKAMNVKRAMKMAQVFGVPPPQDLYQIQTSPIRSLETQNLSRQSLVSLASLAYLLDHDRDSLYDMLANAQELAEEGEDEAPVDWPYERKGTDGNPQVGTVDPQDKATIENAFRRGASTKSKSSSSSGRGSPMSSSPLGASRAGSRSEVNLTATGENSPPPTSGLHKSGSLRRAKSKERIDGVAKLRKEPPPPVPSSPVAGGSRRAGANGPEADFGARRRRANKLSRFFGVGYQDLFNTMLFGLPGSPAGGSSEEPAVPPLPSSQEAPPRKSGGGTVTVMTDDGKEIDLRKSTADWSAAVDQQDLKAMMGRLRALKA